MIDEIGLLYFISGSLIGIVICFVIMEIIDKFANLEKDGGGK